MLAIALATAACSAPVASPTASAATPSPGTASEAPASPPPTAYPTAGATGLLLEVSTEGGFINPAASIGALPQLVVETDGTIYTPDPDAPLALAPAILVRDVGPEGAAAIAAAIRAAGLEVEGSGGIAADTGSTVFTVDLDGSEVVSRYASGGPGGIGRPGGPGNPGGPAASGDPGASGGPAAPGAGAFDLVARLLDSTVAWAGTTGSPHAYAPVGYRVFVAPAAGDAASATVPWPLPVDPSTSGEPVATDLGVTGLRSAFVPAADASPLAPVFAAAPGTLVSAGGKAWQVWVRPAFPHELGG